MGSKKIKNKVFYIVKLSFGGIPMGYKLLSNEINSLFEELKKEYKIYAPKRFSKQGRYSDMVREANPLYSSLNSRL